MVGQRQYGWTMVVLLLISSLHSVNGGHVISRLAARAPRVKFAGPAPLEPEPATDTSEFALALRRLSRGPRATEALSVVLSYLKRARDHPRDGSARRVCLWEPAFRTHLATVDGGLQCLRAAGFGEIEKDRRGTPYLVMGRVAPRHLRELIAMATDALAAAEAKTSSELDDGPSRDREPSKSPSISLSDTIESEGSAGDAVGGGDGNRGGDDRDNGDDGGDGAGGASVERALVEQITSMISGLIKELERPGASTSGYFNVSTDGSGNSSADARSSQAPVHFRVYRSPGGFPGFPGGGSGGGLPFLPGGLGGLGGGVSGEGDEEGEVAVLERKLRAADLPPDAEDVANRELKRLRRMSPMHSEYSTLVDYLEWLADVPWNKTTADKLRISDARAQLEADHFGMEKVKARILEYLSVAKLKGDLRGSILCLLGPPGIGKTSLGKSIADALHRDFYRVSLGGVHSEAEVRGHRRTYVGAMPGLILQALKKCGSNNCVIMLDEIDKLGRNSLNGDPSSALLEVLDPEQNQNFRDHFLNVPFNLSKVLFIATANEIEPIPRPLRDRMEVIEMSGYTIEEKTEIALRHLLPKQRGHHGLSPEDISLGSPTVDALVSGYTREAGVRELDRQLAALCRSVAARAAEASESSADSAEALAAAAAHVDADAAASVNKQGGAAADDDTARSQGAGGPREGQAVGEGVAASEGETGVMEYEAVVSILGPPKFDGPKDSVYRIMKPGIAAGLAYTPVGGELLYVEVEQMGGRGELMLTGQLGDVMQESAKAARSWVRANAEMLGLSPTGGTHLLNATDLHIHFPAGAMPKDGPSAVRPPSPCPCHSRCSSHPPFPLPLPSPTPLAHTLFAVPSPCPPFPRE